MARRKRVARGRLAIAVVVAAAVALILWSNRLRLVERFGAAFGQPGAAVDAPADHVDPKNEGRRVRIAGKVEAAQPARDEQIGISANAAILFRDVEMYQWRETCAAGDCRYEQDWSSQPIDSHKFRHPEGHDNPVAPFASTYFDAAGIRLGAYAVDAALVAAQVARVALPVAANELPPNLAATFRVVDGALYAGGDPAHPQAGTVKVSYRVAAPGKVALAGVQHGNRLMPD